MPEPQSPADEERYTIVVNDPQRHTDTRTILRRLFPDGSPGEIRILVASGSHSFGPGRRNAFRHDLTDGLDCADFAWHDCRSDSLVAIGGGAGWRGHPWLLEEGRLIAIGSVEPHYFAGFTGAHKTCTIGCASLADIEKNHAGALSEASRPCILDGNPVFEGVSGMLSALESHRPVRCVNLVQVGGKIVADASGRPIETLRQLTATARSEFVREVDMPVDAIVAIVNGPLGRSFYQADKGIKNNEFAVRDGGVIVLVAPCAEGIGQDHFVSLLREAPTYAEAVRVVADRGYRLGDHKAVKLRYLTDSVCRAVRVFVVSAGLSDRDAHLLGLIKAESVEAALEEAGLDERTHKILRISDAGNACVLSSRN